MRLHEQLREAFTVELIMTPREQLYCVAEDEKPSPEFTYDLVPVYEKTTEYITGPWVKLV